MPARRAPQHTCPLPGFSAPYPCTPKTALVTHTVPRTCERYWLHSLLFALTVGHRGGRLHADGFQSHQSSTRTSLIVDDHLGASATLLLGLPFSMTLLAILLAHEFGHYISAAFHRVDASLPYFLPSPFLGTFGVLIRVRSPIYPSVPPSISIAGPLAGFVFLVPALAIGLAFQK
jgi:hypothetical protein